MRVLHPRIILSVKTSCRGGCHAWDPLPAAALQLTRTTTRKDTAPLTQSTRAVLVMGGKSLHYNFFSQFQVADLSVLRPVPSLPSFMLKDANSRILCRGQKEDVVRGDPQTNIKWRRENLYWLIYGMEWKVRRLSAPHRHHHTISLHPEILRLLLPQLLISPCLPEYINCFYLRPPTLLYAKLCCFSNLITCRM